jgi:hypothetical protein
MPEIPKLDEEVVDALRQLGSAGMAGPDHRSQTRARRALAAAVMARGERPWFIRLMQRPIHPRSLIAELAVLMIAAVGAVGWSAPAGSPFHGVRLARESITRSLSGENRLDIDLSFAEQSLAEAGRDQARADSEAEAHLFLDDARALLPANVNDPRWQRWQADENALAALSAPPAAPVAVQASAIPRRAPSPKATETGRDGERSGAGGEEGRRPSPSPQPSGSPSPQGSPQASPSPTADH